MIRLALILGILFFSGCTLLEGRHNTERDWRCNCSCVDSKFECFNDGGTDTNIRGKQYDK